MKHMHKYAVRETRESGKEDFEVGTFVTLSISMEDKNGINTSSRSGCHLLQLSTLWFVARESVKLVVTRSVHSTPLRLTVHTSYAAQLRVWCDALCGSIPCYWLSAWKAELHWLIAVFFSNDGIPCERTQCCTVALWDLIVAQLLSNFPLLMEIARRFVTVVIQTRKRSLFLFF